MSDGQDIYQSWADDAEIDRKKRARRPGPSFVPNVTSRMSQGTRGGQYETGNPQIDAFLKVGMGGQPPQSDNPRWYRDPQAFTELMQDFYAAGASGDPEAMRQIGTRYGGSPLQPLLMQAYQEGKKSRQPRQAGY